jgi:hypothetical protein
MFLKRKASGRRSAGAGKQFSLAILFDAERPRPYVIGSVIFVPCRRPGECQFPFHEAGEAAAQWQLTKPWRRNAAVKEWLGVPLAIPRNLDPSWSLRQHHFPDWAGLARKGEVLLYLKGDAMWMADLKHGEHVDELPAYAPAFKEVYRFILEALEGDDVAATRLFRRYLAGEMPEELLGIARCRETAEQSNRDKGDRGLSLQVPALAAWP